MCVSVCNANPSVLLLLLSLCSNRLYHLFSCKANVCSTVPTESWCWALGLNNVVLPFPTYLVSSLLWTTASQGLTGAGKVPFPDFLSHSIRVFIYKSSKFLFKLDADRAISLPSARVVRAMLFCWRGTSHSRRRARRGPGAVRRVQKCTCSFDPTIPIHVQAGSLLVAKISGNYRW